MRKKSLAQKKSEGSTQKATSDMTATGKPTMPKGLSPTAKKLWQSLIPQLVSLGVASQIDQSNLQALCEFWSEYRKCQSALKVLEAGTIDYSRAVNATQKIWQCFSRIAKEFGLSPSSRTGIATTPPVSQNERFFT